MYKFEYCEKCEKEKRGKICECDYPEVKYFLDFVNKQENKEFELFECPDKKGNTYTTDLHYKDKISKEDLWIEVKEVIFNDLKGEQSGQFYMYSIINKALNDMTNFKNCEKLNDYLIYIPYKQFGKHDENNFYHKLIEWFKSVLNDNYDNKLFFERSNGEKIELFIEKKSEELNKVSDRVLFFYQAKEYNSINDIIKEFMDTEHIKNLIISNLKKNEETQSKFPNDAEHKILLNILRLPYGLELFLNSAYEMGYGDILFKSFQSIDKNLFSTISESYFLYYFDYYLDIKNNKHKKLLNCYPLKEGIIKTAWDIEIV